MKWFQVDVLPNTGPGRRGSDIPEGPGVYVFIRDGRVVYVGSSLNLRARLSTYWLRFGAPARERRRRWSCDYRIEGAIVKVSPSTRYGDWLMREVRLIRRLQPLHNVTFRERGRA